MEEINEIVGVAPGALDENALQRVLKLLRGSAPLSEFAVCVRHPAVESLGRCFSIGNTQEKCLALEALAFLSRNAANRPAVIALLDGCGESLEKFAAQNNDLDGHRDMQPDAVHRNLLTVLMCTFDFSFRAPQLLELADSKLRLAFCALAAVLRGPFGQPPMEDLLKGDPVLWESSVQLVSCTARVLCDLTTCDAYFQSTDSRSYENIDIAVLNKEFTRNVAEVSRMLISLPVLDLLTIHLDEWFNIVKKSFSNSMESIMRICGSTSPSRPPTQTAAAKLLDYLEISLTSVLMMISNLLTYTTEYSAKLRKFIACHTIFIQNLILPYVEFLCNSLDVEPDAASQEVQARSCACVKQLLYVIKVLSFVTFRIRVFRAWFRRRNFTERILSSHLLKNTSLRPQLVAMLVRLNVNVNVADEAHGGAEDLLQLFEKTHASLSESEQRQVSRVLHSRLETMYPVDKLCPTFKKLSYMWRQSADDRGDALGEEPEQAGDSSAEEDEEEEEEDGRAAKKPPPDAGDVAKTVVHKVFDGPPMSSWAFDRDLSFKPAWSSSRARGRGRGRGAGIARGRKPYRRHNPRARQAHRQRQRALLTKRWLTLKEKRASGAVEDPAWSDDADAEPAPAAHAAPPAEEQVLQVNTSKVRSALQESSKPEAPPVARPFFTFDDAPSRQQQHQQQLRGGQADAAEEVVIYKPTKLEPMASRHLPKGASMNEAFGAKGVPLSSKAASPRNPFVWTPLTSLATLDDPEGVDSPTDSKPADHCLEESEPGCGGAVSFAPVSSPDDVPDAFLCGLTHQLLRHPLLSPHGNAFERGPILQWLRDNGEVCPVTRKPLRLEDLVPDYDLKKDIEEFRLKTRLESVM
ncbi:U-box domain-containing protein 43 [Diplonema papillatum]|nr:U-box domain-containing protein 43 [Diplonema papillatum]